jgi:hypothetical protein
LKSVANLFDHLCDLLEYVEVKVAVSAPLPFMEGWPAEAHPLLLNVTSALIVLRLESDLLLLRVSRVIRVDLLMLELRVKLVDPLVENPQ